MCPRNVLFLGAGGEGCKLIARLIATRPSTLESIQVQTRREGARTSILRILETLDRECRSPLKSLPEYVIVRDDLDREPAREGLAKVDLVIGQAPEMLDYVPRDRNGEPIGATQRAHLMEQFARWVQPDALLTGYSSLGNNSKNLFGAATETHQCVFIHYLYPAALMLPVEIAAERSESAAGAYEVADFFSAAGYLPLVFEQPYPGYVSNTLHLGALNELAHHYGSELPTPDELASMEVSFRAWGRAVRAVEFGKSDFGSLAPPRVEESNVIMLMIAARIKRELQAIRTALMSRRVRACTAEEVDFQLQQFLKYGTCLRWEHPGFFRFTDLAGISSFLRLYNELHYSLDDSFLDTLLRYGAIGAEAGQGFFNWSPAEIARIEFERTGALQKVRLGIDSAATSAIEC